MSWSGKCLCGMYLGRAKTEYKRPIFFECFLYRNPSVCYEWFSDFVQTIDNLRAVKPHADILLLPYCNIDLLKPHSFRDSTITLLCLTLLIESSTRITPTSATLTDHIIQTTQMHSQIQTTQMHSQRSLYLTWASVTIAPYAISCTKSLQLPECKLKTHSLISLRSFKHFNCCTQILVWLAVVWPETFLFCPLYVFIHFSAAFCTAHCALDLARYHAP